MCSPTETYCTWHEADANWFLDFGVWYCTLNLPAMTVLRMTLPCLVLSQQKCVASHPDLPVMILMMTLPYLVPSWGCVIFLTCCHCAVSHSQVVCDVVL
ncbi:hypothetical protein BKA83DRAFT_4314650 [Pisolithus microcarpus]|nr:hypothetical protein BKA83DRAFT_4314650 [Pisolithus microcarpus]